jgi:hypothetical protein
VSDLHPDFWTASATIAPLLGLTQSVITTALYNATSRLYQSLGRDLSGNNEAIKLRDEFAMLSNISMASVAACITVMTWALVSLGFGLDYTATRIISICVLSLSMATSLALGVRTARAAPRFAQFHVEVSAPNQ